MSAADWFSVAAIAAALVVVIVNLLYITRVRPDPVAFTIVLISLYFVGVYLTALFSTDVYLVRSGILTRLGVIAVFVLLAVDSIARYRRDACHRNY